MSAIWIVEAECGEYDHMSWVASAHATQASAEARVALLKESAPVAYAAMQSAREAANWSKTFDELVAGVPEMAALIALDPGTAHSYETPSYSVTRMELIP